MNATPFHPLRDGLNAARQNLVPGLVLQAFALTVVLLYYFVPATSGFFQALADLKAQGGFLYSALATALFGGLIPFLYLKANPATRATTPWLFLWFYVGFWAYRGIEVDVLYRVQAWAFGDGNAWTTIVPKVLVDQFVYNPLWAAPLQILAYHFMNQRYSLRSFSNFPWKEFVLQKIPTTLISTWGVWIPMVSIIYCLPSPLQIPLFNIALCFWVLLLTALTRPKAQEPVGLRVSDPFGVDSEDDFR